MLELVVMKKGKRKINRKEPDPWKELLLKLQPISKAFKEFIKKRKIAKQEDERRRLKDEEEQRLKEQEALRRKNQEEKINQDLMIREFPRYVGLMDQIILEADTNQQQNEFLMFTDFGNKVVSVQDMYLPYLYHHYFY